jgi:hypothetical protein
MQNASSSNFHVIQVNLESAVSSTCCKGPFHRIGICRLLPPGITSLLSLSTQFNFHGPRFPAREKLRTLPPTCLPILSCFPYPLQRPKITSDVKAFDILIADCGRRGLSAQPRYRPSRPQGDRAQLSPASASGEELVYFLTR